MFWVRSDLESRKKVRVFNFQRGLFWVRSDLESRKKVRVFNFLGWGLFWVRSDLESRKKVRVFNLGGGGVLGKVRLGLWEEFHFWVGRGGCSGTKSQNTRVFWGIWSKISGSLACWCITDSLSHVETNKVRDLLQQFSFLHFRYYYVVTDFL